AASDVDVVVAGVLVSRPYVAMTLRIMEAFGVTVGNAPRGVPGDTNINDDAHFRLAAPQTYRSRTYAIEPDASAASYFWAAAAITGGEVTVEGLSQDSLKG